MTPTTLMVYEDCDELARSAARCRRPGRRGVPARAGWLTRAMPVDGADR